MAFKYRYPNTQLERDSDFLEIKVVEYKPPGFNPGKEGQSFALSNSSQSLKKNVEKPLGYIFLPMPEQIQDTNNVGWGEDSINGIAARGFAMVKDTIESTNIAKGVGDLVTKTGKSIGELSADGSAMNLSSTFFASKAVNTLGGNTSVGGLLARSSGQILNPNKELLFSGVELRGFNFDFGFYPRDEREADTIKQIIRTFKINMNAKNSSKGNSNTSGLFIKSPNVFQLKYKSGGRDHPFLHQFKPMALRNMTVNYTDSGTYATYDDATPVGISMSLQFQELNPVYAEDYEKDKGLTGVGY